MKSKILMMGAIALLLPLCGCNRFIPQKVEATPAVKQDSKTVDALDESISNASAPPQIAQSTQPPQNTSQATDTVSVDGDGNQVQVSGQIDCLGERADSGCWSVVVPKANVRVRPGMHSSVTAYAVRGDFVRVDSSRQTTIADNINWIPVTTKTGIIGWMASKTLGRVAG